MSTCQKSRTITPKILKMINWQHYGTISKILRILDGQCLTKSKSNSKRDKIRLILGNRIQILKKIAGLKYLIRGKIVRKRFLRNFLRMEVAGVRLGGLVGMGVKGMGVKGWQMWL